MTYGFSRDDIGSYLPTYLKGGILEKDPFQVIDEKGVGSLIKMSAVSGKSVSAEMAKESGTVSTFKAGVCGEVNYNSFHYFFILYYPSSTVAILLPCDFLSDQVIHI